MKKLSLEEILILNQVCEEKVKTLEKNNILKSITIDQHSNSYNSSIEINRNIASTEDRQSESFNWAIGIFIVLIILAGLSFVNLTKIKKLK